MVRAPFLTFRGAARHACALAEPSMHHMTSLRRHLPGAVAMSLSRSPWNEPVHRKSLNRWAVSALEVVLGGRCIDGD